MMPLYCHIKIGIVLTTLIIARTMADIEKGLFPREYPIHTCQQNFIAESIKAGKTHCLK